MFDLYKWKFLTRVCSVHNRFVALYYINRHAINNFNSNYGAAKSYEQMKRVVCEHFFSSVSTDRFRWSCVNAFVCVYVCVFSVFFNVSYYLCGE